MAVRKRFVPDSSGARRGPVRLVPRRVREPEPPVEEVEEQVEETEEEAVPVPDLPRRRRRRSGEEVEQEINDSPKHRGGGLIHPVETVPPPVREQKMMLWQVFRPTQEIKFHDVEITAIGFEGGPVWIRHFRAARPLHILKSDREAEMAE